MPSNSVNIKCKIHSTIDGFVFVDMKLNPLSCGLQQLQQICNLSTADLQSKYSRFAISQNYGLPNKVIIHILYQTNWNWKEEKL